MEAGRKDIMTKINYTAEAALYLGSDWQTALHHGARTFPSAAKAIRFALEEAAPVSLRGALMVVNGRPYSPGEMQSLYHSGTYPYARKSEIEARLIEPAEQ